MLKAEQVPETVAHVAEAAWSNDATWQQIIAAVINAWPGAGIEMVFVEEDYVILPLPKENSNAEG